MSQFPSEKDPAAMRWLRAHVALRQLRAACAVPIHRTTFYRWLHNGTLPGRKIVGSWYVAAEDMAHFAQESFNP